MLLRSWRFRSKPVAFWCIGADTLDVAVIRSALGEPLLLACAGLDGRAIGKKAPHGAGLFELSMAVQSRSLAHVAALDGVFCRVFEQDAADAACEQGRVRVAADTDNGLVCDADVVVAMAIAASFRRLGLSLTAIDCAPCAERSLASFLGQQAAATVGAGAVVNAAASRLDPLAAVSVAPEIEEDALRMGERLAVPVGLALGHLGWLGNA
jgi:hypothetical protein